MLHKVFVIIFVSILYQAPAGTEMSSQKCKLQGMSQNRTLPKGMPVQEKRQESQSCPSTTPG